MKPEYPFELLIYNILIFFANNAVKLNAWNEGTGPLDWYAKRWPEV